MAQYPALTRALTRVGVFGMIFLFVAIMGTGCMTTSIDAGEMGVKYSSFDGTDLENGYGEGLQIHAPWTEFIRYEVRVQERLEKLTALSSNGLSIAIEVSVRYRADADSLPQLHTQIGPEYYRILIQSQLRSAAREIVGLYTPEELYSTKRQELQEKVFEQVTAALEGKYVFVDAILIRDVKLPNEITSAIETKLREQQEAQQYEFKIQKERLEAQRKKIEADGEAEYQRIITQSLSTQYLRYKGIEATQELASSPNAKIVVVGSGEDGLPLILGN